MLQPLNVNIWVTSNQPNHGRLWDNIHFSPKGFGNFPHFFQLYFNDVMLKRIISRLTCLREGFQNPLDIFHTSIRERAHENVWNKQKSGRSIRCQCNVLIGAKGDAWRTAVSESTLAKKPLGSWEKPLTPSSARLLMEEEAACGSFLPPPLPLEDTDWPCNSEAEYNSHGSYSRQIFRR